jgi:hypothetical protein
MIACKRSPTVSTASEAEVRASGCDGASEGSQHSPRSPTNAMHLQSTLWRAVLYDAVQGCCGSAPNWQGRSQSARSTCRTRLVVPRVGPHRRGSRATRRGQLRVGLMTRSRDHATGHAQNASMQHFCLTAGFALCCRPLPTFATSQSMPCRVFASCRLALGKRRPFRGSR